MNNEKTESFAYPGRNLTAKQVAHKLQADLTAARKENGNLRLQLAAESSAHRKDNEYLLARVEAAEAELKKVQNGLGPLEACWTCKGSGGGEGSLQCPVCNGSGQEPDPIGRVENVIEKLRAAEARERQRVGGSSAMAPQTKEKRMARKSLPRLADYERASRRTALERWTSRQTILDIIGDHAAEKGEDDYADALKVAAVLHREARPSDEGGEG